MAFQRTSKSRAPCTSAELVLPPPPRIHSTEAGAAKARRLV